MNALIPQPAEIVEKRREAEGIYTVRVRLAAEEARRAYRFLPGQFNMLYAFGAGDVPMSIVSDPEDGDVIGHTLRAVGPVTNALAALKEGDVLGLRGPFGSCWPLDEAKGKDIL
ncbi:Ni/Fe hydrogenase subunit gamma, partial [bacterium]